MSDNGPCNCEQSAELTTALWAALECVLAVESQSEGNRLITGPGGDFVADILAETLAKWDANKDGEQ